MKIHPKGSPRPWTFTSCHGIARVLSSPLQQNSRSPCMRRTFCVLLSLTLFALPALTEERSAGTRFAVAIEDGDLEAIKTLIEEEGSAVDTPIDYGDHSITPLQKAAWAGDLPIVEYLLEKGANVNA